MLAELRKSNSLLRAEPQRPRLKIHEQLSPKELKNLGTDKDKTNINLINIFL